MSSSIVSEKYNQIVRTHLHTFLKDLGFKISGFDFKRKGGNCKQILSTSLRKVRGVEVAYLSINPGFLYEEVQELAAEIQGEERKKSSRTASGNIGLLTNARSFLEWKIDASTDEEVVADEICALIEEVAVPYWDEFDHLESLIQAYERRDRRIWSATTKWKLYACYCLVGRIDEVIAVLHKELEKARASRGMLENSIKNLLVIKQRLEKEDGLGMVEME